MNIEDFVKNLDDVEYGDETTPEIISIAKANGFVIVFAYSDDNCEFQGAIEEEIPSWNGRKIYFNKDGSNFTDERGECFLTYHKDRDEPEANMIEAVWCGNERVLHESGDYYSWSYKTEIPHKSFDVLEDGSPFCRGIVFKVSDLK